VNIAFRVDASAQIGTGHFMRCLTLADALSRFKIGLRFVSRHMPRHFRDQLSARGYEFADIGGVGASGPAGGVDHARWLGTSQAEDAAGAMRALSDRLWDWLVVDHYALDAEWESMLRPAVRHIACIDDIADRRHDCDLLLDQNHFSDMQIRYGGKVPAHCQMLLGPRYALLRREFAQLHARAQPRNGAVKRVLVFFGGVDADDVTGIAVEALAGLRGSGVHVDVVIGKTHPAAPRLADQCVQHGFELHVQTERMAELMAAADLAVGAGGTAVWERCCLGLPALVVALAENQRRQIADAAREGLVYAPDVADGMAPLLARHVRALIENGALRSVISRTGLQAVDGEGASRVARRMGCRGIELRRALAADSRHIFEWRNDPAVRAVSRSGDEIGWSSHERWFAETLDSTDRLLLVGERAGSAVGVVRFDMSGHEAEISIYLVPGAHPRGEGSELLLTAEGWLAANRAQVTQIRAHVLGGNQRSHALFLGAGYRAESTSYLKRLH
jgi:UDP-2,4-diacetamido-2,4,6-trideoxy-beta-L-altropyranose hydrolase